jgi:hypothetical protein
VLLLLLLLLLLLRRPQGLAAAVHSSERYHWA